LWSIHLVLLCPAVTLPHFNRIQKTVALLFVALLANSISRATTGYFLGVIGTVVLVIAFLVLLPFALAPLIRRVTWRVRNRLFLTYVLVGILPIVLIYLFGQLGFTLVLGQTTNYMLHTELDRRLEQVHRSAERSAQALLDGKEPGSLSVGSEQGVVVRAGEKTSVIPGSAITEFSAWSKPGFKGIVCDRSGNLHLAAHAQVQEGNRTAEAFAVRSLDVALLADLLPGMASLAIIEGQTIRFRVGARGSAPAMRIVLDSSDTAPPPPKRGAWDSDIEAGSPLELRSLETGESEPAAMIAYTRSSAILSRVFSTLGPTANLIFLFMAIVAGTFLAVEIIAVVASVKLARTLTRTVHDLYVGTKKVETGDFSHRIPVRAKDQLSELASSFNGMTKHIEQLIADVKEKEKLESELEIARQVQAQLFPKEVPKLKTLELAGVCNPARVVSGDYYDFIPIESRGAAVVLGDISGKGISAALLMASVQAAMHAQLSMGSAEDVSTATIVTRLNRQLYANTPPEKYATFYFAVYDDKDSRLTYTNAGHLAPILIRNGEAIRLEPNGTVVGLFPEFPFEQVDVQMQPGDLLAAFTDGITESEDASEEQFGEDRLIELLRRNVDLPLDEIIQSVMDAVAAWAHDPSSRDDITMLLARKL
jgi:sigma-B regulation protein RsbU (phosphoserine phosphatase)